LYVAVTVTWLVVQFKHAGLTALVALAGASAGLPPDTVAEVGLTDTHVTPPLAEHVNV